MQTKQEEAMAGGGKLPLFYRQPEILNARTHGGLELQNNSGYEFARAANAIPLTVAEFAHAARHYPIVFANVEKPAALAIVGLKTHENLMVREDGTWLEGSYIPSYVRRYPFLLSRNRDATQFALCIDRAAPMVGEGDRNPLFNGADMSELTQKALKFSTIFQQQAAAGEKILTCLAEHALLTRNQGTFQLKSGESLSLTNFLVVDENRLNSLSDAAFLEIRKAGALSAIYCHLVSLNSWGRLIQLMNRQQGG